MKVNQRLIIIICIAVFIIAAAVLYLQYQKQVTARTTAQSTLSSAQANLTKMTADKTKAQKNLDAVNSQLADLQIQLTQTVQNLAEQQKILPPSVVNIDYNEIIFNIAGNCNVTILTLGSNAPVDNIVNNLTFSVSGFTMSVQGQMSDILNFIDTLATDSRLANGIINSVSTSKVSLDTPSGTQEAIQAEISISLYSYKGS